MTESERIDELQASATSERVDADLSAKMFASIAVLTDVVQQVEIGAAALYGGDVAARLLREIADIMDSWGEDE